MCADRRKLRMSSLQVLLKWLSRQSLQRVRWSLIGVLGFWSAVHILWLPEGPAFDRNSYDQMVKRRLLTPSPDSKIVIVDIDERSLDELKQEFGRWPWPRETLASVLEWVNRQGAQAVVFDILFADADMLNPASDAAFVQTVQASDNTYFPVLRLNPENDHLSEILAHQLPGFTSQAKTEALSSSPRLAVVPPVFEALIQSRRLGYHNIYADDDGVNRFYQLWEEKDGWRLWSLPARLAMDLKWPLPEQPKVLIQYTQHKDAFKSVSFSEIWKLSQTSAGQKPYPMFKDAVVVIGATATSLFDVKVTPLATTHPGVMILANVIDNLKNQRFLRLVPGWTQVVIAWLGLLLMAWVSGRIREDQMKWAVPAAPSLFLGLGYLGLNSGQNIYLDLVPSASHALLFFSAWTVYLNWRTRFFIQPARLADQIEPTAQETFAVFQMRFQTPEMGEILDRLPHECVDCTAIQLGALGQLPYLQQGLIYIAIRTAHDRNGAMLLRRMLDTLPQTPQKFFISPPRSPLLGTDRHWQQIWEDTSTAQYAWRSTHVQN